MIKLVGILLIVGAMSAAGIECSSMIKKRVISLEAFVKLLDSMAVKIGTFSTPLSEFFNTYKDDRLDSCGFLKAVSESVSFSEAVKARASALCLEEGDVSLLGSFGEGLGGLSAAEEAKRCLYFKGECEKLLDEAKEALPVKTKLLKSAGVMCGILAAVLLI